MIIVSDYVQLKYSLSNSNLRYYNYSIIVETNSIKAQEIAERENGVLLVKELNNEYYNSKVPIFCFTKHPTFIRLNYCNFYGMTYKTQKYINYLHFIQDNDLFEYCINNFEKTSIRNKKIDTLFFTDYKIFETCLFLIHQNQGWSKKYIHICKKPELNIISFDTIYFYYPKDFKVSEAVLESDYKIILTKECIIYTRN